MHGREQPVARAVTGEDPAGAIAAVRRRGQAEQQDPCLLVTPARNRPAPVPLLLERAARLEGHPLAPAHQARAGTAHGLPGGEFEQVGSLVREQSDVGRRVGDRGGRGGRITWPAGAGWHRRFPAHPDVGCQGCP